MANKTQLSNSFEYQSHQSQERLLAGMHWVLITGATIGVISPILLIAQGQGGPQSVITIGLLLSIILVNVAFIRWQENISYPIRAGVPIVLISLVAASDFYIFGLTGEARIVLLIIIALTYSLSTIRIGTAVAVSSVLIHIGIGYLINQQILTPLFVRTPDNTLLWSQSILAGIVGSLIVSIIFTLILRDALQILTQQQTLIKEIDTQRNSLERIVSEKTQVLTIMNHINQTLTSILDPERLMAEVVEQVQHAFGYYHVLIYTLHEKEQILAIRGGTGEAGSVLLLGHHSTPLSRGLLGRCAREKRPILVHDVTKDIDWVANPLLPETKSELVVPILSGNKVLGVLDIQHNVAYDLDHEDEQLLTNIALQLGIALQNADIYTRTQERLNRSTILQETTRKIQFSPDLETTLKVVVEVIGQELKTTQTNAGLDLTALKKVTDTINANGGATK